jgi:hypothetical protein
MPLITDILPFRKYSIVGKDLLWSSVAPAVHKAEQTYFIETIGRQFYNDLVTNNTNVAYSIAIDLAQAAIVNLAIWLYLKTGALVIDDSGIYVPKTDNKWIPSDKQLKDIEQAYCLDAMDSLETFLIYLESEAIAQPSSFPVWQNSVERQQYNALFIIKSAHLSDYVQIHRSNLTYISLRPTMSYVERHQIAPVMGGYYANLKAMPSPTGVDYNLLLFAREALAKLSAAKALRLGMMIWENNRIGYSYSPKNLPEQAICEYENDGRGALQALRDELERTLPAGYVSIAPNEKVFNVNRKGRSLIYAS